MRMAKRYLLLMGVNRYDFDTPEEAEAFMGEWRGRKNISIPETELLEVARAVKRWPPRPAVGPRPRGVA